MNDPAVRHLPPDPAPTLDYLSALDAWVRAHYVYRVDADNRLARFRFDHWRTMLPEILRALDGVEGDLPIPGDCDDLSFTVVDTARYAGFEPEHCRLILCSMPFGASPFDHMIGAVLVDGVWHVVGDTEAALYGLAGVYEASRCPHRLYEALALPLNGARWRRVREWKDV